MSIKNVKETLNYILDYRGRCTLYKKGREIEYDLSQEFDIVAEIIEEHGGFHPDYWTKEPPYDPV